MTILSRRIEALEKMQSAHSSTPAVIIQVGMGASVSVEPTSEDKIGFRK
jgi:hypothetical protein